ncbi:MAG: gliding motility-associated C-terminal domain-containing protein, partial [Bacteroidetes bacterium]
SCDPNQVGTDTLFLTNFQGCDSLVVTQTTLEPIPPVFNVATTCDPDAAGLDTLILVSVQGCDSVVITQTDLLPSSLVMLSETSCDPNQVGTDTLFLTNFQGCDSLVVTQTTLSDGITAADIQVEGLTCLTSAGAIIIAKVEGGTAPYLYSIDGGNTFLSEPIFPNLVPGTYPVVIEDSEGCRYETEAEILAAKAPAISVEAEHFIGLGESVNLNAATNLTPAETASIAWLPADSLSCADCLNPVAAPPQAAVYLLTVTDTAGCVATASVTVFVKATRDVYFPNVFSPNGDGINDRFLAFGDEKLIAEVRSLQIFSRWGDFLFETQHTKPNDTTTGWDGSRNGDDLPPGVYIFKAQVVFTDGEIVEFFGDVTLIR